MAGEILTLEVAREWVRYEPETGHFFRLKAYQNSASLGRITARPHYVNGYFYISVNGKRCLAHRLAWFLTHGVWPTGQIDHINGVRSDNRLCNLRDVEPRANSENRRKAHPTNTSSGVRGVSWHIHSAAWRARINTHGVERRLGIFDTIEEASMAYEKAKQQMHAGYVPGAQV